MTNSNNLLDNLANTGNNIENKSTNNLVNDELVTILNNLSNLIKTLMKNYKIYLGSAKISSDSVKINY